MDMLKKITKEFTWGPVIATHTISNIQIIESKSSVDESQFFIYIDYEDAHVWTQTLDEAIIVAMSIKYDGTETAGIMFERMLRMHDKENADV